MDYKEIKRLMDDMGNSKLTGLDIEFPDGTKIKLEKKPHEALGTKVVMSAGVNNTALAAGSSENRVSSPKEDGKIVTSPMVGTFYSKPSPSAKSFVEIGSKVKKGDTLCIIEAMKLMNEIEAEFDGTIAEILVRDEEMVDFGKKLFVIK